MKVGCLTRKVCTAKDSHEKSREAEILRNEVNWEMLQVYI